MQISAGQQDVGETSIIAEDRAFFVASTAAESDPYFSNSSG